MRGKRLRQRVTKDKENNEGKRRRRQRVTEIRRIGEGKKKGDC